METDAELVLEAARATLAGTAPFPEIVAKLVAAGVEYYHVDYALMQKTYYGGAGDAVMTLITDEYMPPVAAEFDAAALKAAILDSRQHGQKYRDFSRRAPRQSKPSIPLDLFISPKNYRFPTKFADPPNG